MTNVVVVVASAVLCGCRFQCLFIRTSLRLFLGWSNYFLGNLVSFIQFLCKQFLWNFYYIYTLNDNLTWLNHSHEYNFSFIRYPQFFFRFVLVYLFPNSKQIKRRIFRSNTLPIKVVCVVWIFPGKPFFLYNFWIVLLLLTFESTKVRLLRMNVSYELNFNFVNIQHGMKRMFYFVSYSIRFPIVFALIGTAVCVASLKSFLCVVSLSQCRFCMQHWFSSKSLLYLNSRWNENNR